MKLWVRRTLRICANVYLGCAFTLIFLCYALVWYFEGFAKLREIMDPFNLYNWGAVIVTLLPGILLLKLSERS
jgi:hypothetical protein